MVCERKKNCTHAHAPSVSSYRTRPSRRKWWGDVGSAVAAATAAAADDDDDDYDELVGCALCCGVQYTCASLCPSLNSVCCVGECSVCACACLSLRGSACRRIVAVAAAAPPRHCASARAFRHFHYPSP